MSGIAGIVYPDLFQVNDLIIPMLSTLKYGAKKETHTYNNIQIGSCVEPLAANDKKNVVVAFDGILYNSQALKGELTKRGYKIRSNRDQELIVHGYELWGRDLLKELDGEFALAILDCSKKRLIIARDRIGKKAIYWFQSPHTFVFATQLKALLATGAVPQTPAPDALASYFYFGYLPQDLTPIQDTSKLLPGHYLQFQFDGSKTIESYWSYSSYFEKPIYTHKNTIAKQLDSYMIESMKKRLPEKKSPVGCFVSGGLGSAAVAYYTQKTAKDGLDAFTVGFSGENNADIDAAKEVTKSLNIAQHIKVVEPEAFINDLVPIIWHLDEPLADPNVVATWELARLAASHGVQNVYSGMGSDELFAGHTRYTVKEQKISLLAKLFYLPMPFLIKFVIPLIAKVNKSSAYRLLKMARTNPWQFEYLNHNALFSEKELSQLSPKLAGLFDPEVFLHKFHHIQRIESLVSSLLYLDVKTRLPDCFISQYERLSAAHNLKWSAPFLDQSLVEFLASLPEPERLPESEAASFLKAVIHNIFPPSFINRPKLTRPNFLNRWVESPAITELFPLLKSGTLVETGFISAEWLHTHLKSQEKRTQSFRLLWALLVLEIWFRLFINRAILKEAPQISVKALLQEH